MTHRLVVPSAFVELLLAEQTTATLCCTRLGLRFDIVVNEIHSESMCLCDRATYMTTWSTMLKANFPTLVPPNFWTTQLLEHPLTNGRESESDGN